MFRQFKQFRTYLQKTLCPQQLETEWGFWGNLSAFIAYLALKGRGYPFKKQNLSKRWKKFAQFLFINSMDKEGGWKGKPIPTSLLGSYAGTYLKALSNPMYFLWLFEKVSSLKAQGIDYPFIQE